MVIAIAMMASPLACCLCHQAIVLQKPPADNVHALERITSRAVRAEFTRGAADLTQPGVT